jgi:hypothetical protein
MVNRLVAIVSVIPGGQVAGIALGIVSAVLFGIIDGINDAAKRDRMIAAMAMRGLVIPGPLFPAAWKLEYEINAERVPGTRWRFTRGDRTVGVPNMLVGQTIRAIKVQIRDKLEQRLIFVRSRHTAANWPGVAVPSVFHEWFNLFERPINDVNLAFSIRDPASGVAPAQRSVVASLPGARITRSSRYSGQRSATARYIAESPRSWTVSMDRRTATLPAEGCHTV